MIDIKKKRRPNLTLKMDTLKNILKYRARGYTMDAIAKIFDLGSRQEIYKIIRENKNNPEVSYLYREIEITKIFLKRDFKCPKNATECSKTSKTSKTT
jgi:predicted acetyltransferase